MGRLYWPTRSAYTTKARGAVGDFTGCRYAAPHGNNASFERTLDHVDDMPAQVIRPATLVARGLTKVYRMGEVEVHALRGVDFELYRGRVRRAARSFRQRQVDAAEHPRRARRSDVAATSSSATTMLTRADERELTRFRREHVGFVFQFYNLIPSLTARENVALVTEIAQRADGRRARRSRSSGSSERVDHFPAQLSGGEQQRVAIARAIAKQPGRPALRRADRRARHPRPACSCSKRSSA